MIANNADNFVPLPLRSQSRRDCASWRTMLGAHGTHATTFSPSGRSSFAEEVAE
jgi:hypothetical protein